MVRKSIKGEQSAEQVTNPDHRGERQLIAAVLIRAARDMAGSGICYDNTKAIRAEIVRWLHADHRTQGNFGFSYLDVCDALDLPPEPVREKILSGELGRMFDIDGYRATSHTQLKRPEERDAA